MSCKAEEKAKPLLLQHKTAALLDAFSPEPWGRVAEGGESPYFKYLSNTCEAVQLVKRLFLSQEPIMKAGGSSYACWEKQGTGTAERPWKMMRMKTRFHRVMGGSKLELPFSFRTWGAGGGACIWRGEWSIDSQVFRSSSHKCYDLNTDSQCNSYHLPTPPCDQPVCFPTNSQGDLGRPISLERRHRMELSHGDASTIHLPLYNYLWIFGYMTLFFAPQFAGICRDRTLL